jgi:outer membrane cobalamin receptor
MTKTMMMRTASAFLALGLISAGAVAAAGAAGEQTVDLAPLTVTATRSATPEELSPFSTRVVLAENLENAPGLTLDQALRAYPSFSLFRRSDSLAAHPTTQGVSLRGLGPSGASRSLVLLDGVPLNDPFGGWVQWAKVPRDSVDRVELVTGGGATAWGNAALGGVIQLLSREPVRRGGEAALTLGDFGTRSVEWDASERLGSAGLQVSGRVFSTDGYHLVAPEAAGPVDEGAGTRHQVVSARWLQQLTPDTTATLTFRHFHETRSNGTPYQANSSEENFASLRVSSKPSKTFEWEAVAYGQDESFASTFGAVNATRTSETPASEQYDVPASALGAALTGTWTAADGSRTTVGGDARAVRGETRENMT